jgi:hypothetical protein
MPLSDLLPPTDNLYKFFAITGLLILGWTSAGVVYLDFRSGEKVHALLESNAQFVAAVHAVQANKSPSAEPDTSKISPDALKTVESSIPILQAKENEAMDDVSTANQWFAWFSKVAYFSGWLGCILTGLGFVFWYMRVQIKEDRLLRLSIEKMDLECQQLRKDLTLPPTSPDSGKHGRTGMFFVVSSSTVTE